MSLTETKIKALPLGKLTDKGNPYIARDARVPGLFVEVNKRSKSYKIQLNLYRGTRPNRVKVGTVRQTLGTTEELTLDEARKRAGELLAGIKRGEDPRTVKGTSADNWTLAQMYAAHVEARRRQDSDATHSENILRNSRVHLADWQTTRIRDITPDMWNVRYERIHAYAGQWAAKNTLKQFRAAYNYALKKADKLPADPTRKVDLFRIKATPRQQRALSLEDLPAWFAKLQKCTPIRALMHELTLFSGLRPGHAGGIRREWVDLARQVIRFPKLKAGKPFDLPLSGHMMKLIAEAIRIGGQLHSGSEFLFPNKIGEATEDWREEGLFAYHEKGHSHRRTYITLAQSISMNATNSQLLTDHTVPGTRRIYLETPHLFRQLLEEQERMSALILSHCGLARAEGVVSIITKPAPPLITGDA